MLDIRAEPALILLDEQAADGSVRTLGRDPELDIALGPALLHQVAAAGGPPTLRLYRPQPTMAFSGRDCATPGIDRAAQVARAAGFAPLRRGPGGRAAAYHRGALCVDHVGVDPGDVGRAGGGSAGGGPAGLPTAGLPTGGPAGIQPRFVRFGGLLAGALREVGVDARVGPVPGEYCPGDFSINDGHGHKLVGTAQRLVRGGWLFSAVILVSDPEPVREVLTGTYDALGLDWDPLTVGAVHTTAPGVSIADVESAVLAAYGRLGPLVPSVVGADLVDLALSRADRHRLPAP